MNLSLIIIFITISITAISFYFLLKHKKSLSTVLKELDDVVKIKNALTKDISDLEEAKTNLSVEMNSLINKENEYQKRLFKLDEMVYSAFKEIRNSKYENEGLDRSKGMAKMQLDTLNAELGTLDGQHHLKKILIKIDHANHLKLEEKIKVLNTEYELVSSKLEEHRLKLNKEKLNTESMKKESELLSNLKLSLEKENSQLLFEIANKKKYLED